MKAWLPALLLLSAACTPRIILWPTGNTLPSDSASSAPATGIANPASGFCTQNNGKLLIRRDAQGAEAGYCVFTDLSYCEEWSYYRAQCKPGDNPNFPLL